MNERTKMKRFKSTSSWLGREPSDALERFPLAGREELLTLDYTPGIKV